MRVDDRIVKPIVNFLADVMDRPQSSGEALLANTLKNLDTLKLVLVGHSLGAGVALELIEGAVLSSIHSPLYDIQTLMDIAEASGNAARALQNPYFGLKVSLTANLG